jgi:hypothetical protein
MRRPAVIVAATAALVALAPATALAQSEPAPARSADEIAAKLNDPMTQYAIAGMISAMSKALLEMPVAPMLDAVEKASGKRMGNLPRDARVADLAGADQERVREQIVTHVPRAMAAMGALATAAGAMAPELERMAKTMRESMPRP